MDIFYNPRYYPSSRTALPRGYCSAGLKQALTHQIRMSETRSSPMPRSTRMNSSFMAVRVLGHAAHDAERACKGGEHCDDYFEDFTPVDFF